MKKRILFLCTHNSARSQMAEGYLRARHGDRYEAHSAGTKPASVHPAAVAVMREIGIDISGQRAKHLSEFAGKEMDLVVAVCESARGACPFFPWAKEVLHVEFPDPSQATGSEAEIMEVFRDARDRITTWIDAQLGKNSR